MLSRFFVPVVVVSAMLVQAAHAKTITNFTTTLTTANATELGRFSRNSVPQDWSGSETYPGVINTTTPYYYAVYSFSSALFAGAPYVEINTFEVANTLVYFLAAYAGSYNANNRSVNWLGDAGFSGNYQTNDGGDFQVILPSGSDLILVLNTTGGGTAGLGTAININVAAYADTLYSEPTPVPEPSAWLMLGTGLFATAGAVRRKLQTAA